MCCRFRLGLHTGECLVGNFGCKYRVNYTCLGDAVNLASRLEALNKKFGTVVCVSHATFAKAAAAFHFRLLADVTVPGKSEVGPRAQRWALTGTPAADMPRVPGRGGVGLLGQTVRFYWRGGTFGRGEITWKRGC